MLALRVFRLPDGAALDPVGRPVNPAGAVIGRSQECDVVLEDPLRLVSRRHAWLVPDGSDTGIVHCISASASLTVNGEVVPPGGERPVAVGDRIGIGPFELALEEDRSGLLSRRPRVAVPAEANPPPVPDRAPPPAEAPVHARPRVSRLDQWFDLETAPDPLRAESPLPPAASPAARSESPSSPAAAPAAEAREPSELQRAFLQAAGLSNDASLGRDPQWAAHVGGLLRALVEGQHELLRTRAITKQGLRAEGTQLAARANNPLKFAPDAQACLQLLLEPEPQPGFLAPLDALRDAQRDLQMHQLAMVAGMRAAAAELLLQLGPSAIEAAAPPPSGLARYFPTLRDAALWRSHCERHARLLANIDDAFEAAFGREFLAAYEAQAGRHARRGQGDGPLSPDVPGRAT
jgi:type VI secretion system FHA domain protein